MYYICEAIIYDSSNKNLMFVSEIVGVWDHIIIIIIICVAIAAKERTCWSKYFSNWVPFSSILHLLDLVPALCNLSLIAVYLMSVIHFLNHYIVLMFCCQDM